MTNSTYSQGKSASRLARVLIDADVNASKQIVNLMAKSTEIGSDVRREEENAGAGECRIDLLVRFVARSPAREQRLDGLPVGVPPGRLCFTYSRCAVA